MFFLIRPSNGGVLDKVVHLMLVFIIEWGDANDHLINKDA
jgi:hypothetical protein